MSFDTAHRSARSSTSSTHAHPLTPVYELSSNLDDMAIASSSGSSNNDDEEDLSASLSGGGTNKHTSNLPSSPSLPSSSFSFGTCPSVPINRTPTYEFGPFDYPVASTSTSTTHMPNSPRRPSLALGMTHRRGSIVPRTNSTDSDMTIPVAPSTRRSSTCSTITTLPAAGTRPSILHSASTNSGPPPPPHMISPPGSRRSSLLFPQKPLVAPIPPSLLARRGSLPVSQLIPLDTSRARASFALPGNYTTTTPALYKRRESVMSDGEASSSSGHTVTRRDSLLPDISPELMALQPRRTSLPHSAIPRPSSPVSPPIERKSRIPSIGSRLRQSSLTSSDGDEESDETDTLPTPGTAGIFDGFTDPWASVETKKTVGQAIMEGEPPILGRPIQ